MKLIQVIRLIIAIAITSICTTEILPAEETLDYIFSNVKEHLNQERGLLHDSLKKKKGGPFYFEQDFGSEIISIDFPKAPSIKKKDGMLMAVAKENKIEYSFLAPIPAVFVYSEELFSFLFSELNSYPYSVIDYNAYEEYFGDVMEIISMNNKNKKILKVKAIATYENFYLISVEFPLDKDSPSTNQFLDSFKIID